MAYKCPRCGGITTNRSIGGGKRCAACVRQELARLDAQYAEWAKERREKKAQKLAENREKQAQELEASEFEREHGYQQHEHVHYSLCCPRCEQVVLTSASDDDSAKCPNCRKPIKLLIRKYNNGAEKFWAICSINCSELVEEAFLNCPQCRAKISPKFLTAYSDRGFSFSDRGVSTSQQRAGCKPLGCLVGFGGMMVVPMVVSALRIDDTNREAMLGFASIVTGIAAYFWFVRRTPGQKSNRNAPRTSCGSKVQTLGFEIPDSWLAKSRKPLPFQPALTPNSGTPPPLPNDRRN
jgi:hypothetical protein